LTAIESGGLRFLRGFPSCALAGGIRAEFLNVRLLGFILRNSRSAKHRVLSALPSQLNTCRPEKRWPQHNGRLSFPQATGNCRGLTTAFDLADCVLGGAGEIDGRYQTEAAADRRCTFGPCGEFAQSG
jgi:hypothetical protein